MKLPVPLEHQIQTACIQYLRYKGFYVQRMNSGAMRMQSKGKDYLLRMAAAGTPDLMAFKKISWDADFGDIEETQLLFIEVKRPGKKPTPLQTEKMKELEEHGASCYVIHSVEELQAIVV